MRKFRTLSLLAALIAAMGTVVPDTAHAKPGRGTKGAMIGAGVGLLVGGGKGAVRGAVAGAVIGNITK